MPDSSLRQDIGEAIKTLAANIKGRDGMLVLVFAMWFAGFAWTDKQKLMLQALEPICWTMGAVVALTVANDILRLWLKSRENNGN